jgi:transcriptional regulator with XRE-family HTH domain
MTTTAGSSPIVGRRRLRSVLRRARDESGQTQEQVAAAMDWSPSKLIRIESGQVTISTNDLRALLGHYQISDDGTVHALVELARASRQRPWWWEQREGLGGTNLGTLIGLEEEATEVCAFQPTLLQGQLQTEEYAQAIFADDTIAVPPEAVAARLAIRLGRKERMLAADSTQFVLILDQATLSRQVAPPPVMVSQLRHLITFALQPHITLGVLPFSAGVYPTSGGFELLSFDDDPPIVYEEMASTDALIEDPEKVDAYRRTFDTLRRKALSAEDSVALIARMADEYAAR